MVVDQGHDFPPEVRDKLNTFGSDMWLYRQHDGETTRALNSYLGEVRGFVTARSCAIVVSFMRDHRFQYLTPRIRITPRDLVGTRLANPKHLHFICSPERALTIIAELEELLWDSVTIFEPIPVR
jgi:hypothetical protein